MKHNILISNRSSSLYFREKKIKNISKCSMKLQFFTFLNSVHEWILKVSKEDCSFLNTMDYINETRIKEYDFQTKQNELVEIRQWLWTLDCWWYDYEIVLIRSLPFNVNTRMYNYINMLKREKKKQSDMRIIQKVIHKTRSWIE